jgi:glucuronate isomerase
LSEPDARGAWRLLCSHWSAYRGTSDDLSAHAALVDDPTWTGRVIPTFRPDAYLEVSGAG